VHQAPGVVQARCIPLSPVITRYSSLAGSKLKSAVRMQSAVCGLAWKGPPLSSASGGWAACAAACACRRSSSWVWASRCACEKYSRCVVITRSGPQGACTVATLAMRGMLRRPGAGGQGKAWCCASATGSRDAMTLPKRRRPLPSSARSSTAAPKQTSKPGSRAQHLRRLVLRRVAPQTRVVDRHLLQAQHVEVGHRARVLHHAGHVDTAVQAAEPLHVPGDQFHGGLT
jgi:hypothetical protein